MLEGTSQPKIIKFKIAFAYLPNKSYKLHLIPLIVGRHLTLSLFWVGNAGQTFFKLKKWNMLLLTTTLTTIANHHNSPSQFIPLKLLPAQGMPKAVLNLPPALP